MVAILVLLTFAIAIAVSLLLAKRKASDAPVKAPVLVPMAEPHAPQGMFFDRSHTWLRITPDGAMRVGIDSLLAEALGQVESIKVPERGTRVERGEPLVTLKINGRELVIPSPASGEVMNANPRVLSDPWTVTQDPYGLGWMVALWTRDHQAAIESLRIGGSATSFLHKELQRLADFLTPVGTSGAIPMMADGGVPNRGAAALLDEQGWKKFSEAFVSVPVSDRAKQAD